jgi:phosphatidylglycerophosphate synthase
MSVALIILVAALVVALLSMVVYAALGGRQDRDATRKGSQLALGVGNFLVHWFMWVLTPLERALVALHVSPDALNLGGLLFGLASGVALAFGRLELGGWAIVLGGVCDILDGRVARARQLASPYGAFIDSTLDRFVEVFAFLGFIVYLRDLLTGPLFAAAAMAGGLLVSYTRARGESVGILCKGGLMQRAERMTLMCVVCFAEPPCVRYLGTPPGHLTWWVMVVIAVGTFGTAIYRTLWIGARLRAGAGTPPPSA